MTDRERELDREVTHLRKVVEVLTRRVEQATDWSSDGCTLFERALSLQDEVERRTQEISATHTELEGAIRRLRKSEDLLDRTGQVAGVGGWELELEPPVLRWTAQTCRIHEVPLDYRPTVEHAIEFYAPEARPLIAAAVKAAMVDGTPWDLQLPLVTASGRRIWVRATGIAESRDGPVPRERALGRDGGRHDGGTGAHHHREPVNQRVAVGILRKLGIDPVGVVNGAEALMALDRDPYDLVFMDVQMPELDGFAATSELRRREPPGLNRAVPVVAMTAHAMQGDRERCLEAGMNDYIAKPISLQSVGAAVEHWCPSTVAAGA